MRRPLKNEWPLFWGVSGAFVRVAWGTVFGNARSGFPELDNGRTIDYITLIGLTLIHAFYWESMS